MGVVGLAVSLTYTYEAVKTLPMGKISEPGPAAFPLVVGVFTAVVSLAIVVEEFVVRRDPARDKLEIPRGLDLWRLLGTVLGTFGYVAVLSAFGFLPASILLSMLVVRLLKGGSWIWTIITAVAIAGSTYVLFGLILGVPLPRGDLL